MDANRARRVIAAAVGIASFAPIAALRGFTVDDAWIPARYAANLVRHGKWAFDANGPPTDGVTPLPWVPIVAALGGGSVERGFEAARLVGVVAWVIAAMLLGREAARTPGSRLRFVALLPIVLSAPLAAWSVAGLETGLVTLLVTIAATARSALAQNGAIGAAAAFRPEMLPLAAFLGAMRARPLRSSRVLAFSLAVGPWLAVAAIRRVAFGRFFPLAVLAKPSDLDHGAAYVVAGLVLAGAPMLATLPLGRELVRARLLVVAALVHASAVALAGGDWMPFSRLLVPTFPLWIVAAIDVGAAARPWSTGVRVALATVAMAWTWVRGGAAARHVLDDRRALVANGRTTLASSHVVATLDVGWVGAAFDGPIVDLAGLTDPAFASLPGGHTSKRVPGAMLASRDVDTLVFLRTRGCEGSCVDADGGPFERAVEARLAEDSWVVAHFSRVTEIRGGPLVYVVLRRRDD